MRFRTERIIERLNTLASISDSENCIDRVYGTEAHTISGNVLITWMQEAGLKAYRDTIGNIKGELTSSKKGAKHFIIGSHYDTVFDAGKYDGPLGILLGLEVAEYFYENNIPLPFHLNIVAFADEEGARYNTAYLGSSAIAGCFEHEWLERKDDSGISLAEVLKNNACDNSTINNDAFIKENCLGYFEAHIEQGPVLCNEDLPVCLVDGIASQTRINVAWSGVSGHAGTYPMMHRNDAFCASAAFALEVEKIGKDNTDKLVATIGKLNLFPNTPNVIPGKVIHTLDIRSSDDDFLKEVSEILEDRATEIAKERNIDLVWDIKQTNPSVQCDETLKEVLRTSIKNSGIKKIVELPSGAGHDAVMVSKIAPVSMLFIRCKEGISHNPLEYASPEDIEKSLEVCDNFILELKKQYD
ncbi:M20 family metallo-hydrolase [Cellulophaga baltica]|uniref:M20 family metallo-hydrolase n=1 Tax=Cellulophaga TaxID=104264 RepID=UPI001C06B119|nr:MULTISPECIES: M20 family metallo-hydrolase [Cellulophaga]MBU2996632.1 M20 family metallo-hydrolase [Cellulophaga baltica]MDO6768026.1 M20 family metallo-hydrolase [Cellulophaga sp. 1_MG-2023]